MVGKMSIYSVVHYIIIAKSAGTNGLKYFMLCFKFIIIIGKIETSDLQKTFPDFLL